jgi:hypothetical protein
VTRVYVRDSSAANMTADEKTQRDAGSTCTDRIGKVFLVVGQDVRRCLVCEQFFTRRASSEHATVVCDPAIPCGAEHALGAARTSVDLS